MDAQLLLNDDGDIQDDVINEPPVPGPKNPLNFASDRCRLALLHSKIKHSANVPINLRFEALLRGPFYQLSYAFQTGLKNPTSSIYPLLFQLHL